jgi:F0F1-type ATP synthase membrane subunit c/vacuolar-type H+-ATPase subunit K
MRSWSAFIRALFVVAACLSCAFWMPSAAGQAAGQAAERERPKLKEFGKSIERLKWDELGLDGRLGRLP